MTFQIDKPALKNALVGLIKLASTNLPPDVVKSLQEAQKNEPNGSVAHNTLGIILKNIEMAREKETPICQDTGTNIYQVMKPVGVATKDITALIHDATREATAKSYLRPNTVDSLDGINTGDNIGILNPYIHVEEWDEDALEIKLMLKGGGCENVSDQYTLPNTKLGAGRDLDGVYKVIIDAVNNAQGLGCAPGILGIGIGGDRTTSMIMAKKQLFRKMDEKSPRDDLAELEEKLYTNINKLGIGPMGFGGKTTVLGVKVGYLHRLPASFFVTISYMCWAHRRHSLSVKNGEYHYD